MKPFRILMITSAFALTAACGGGGTGSSGGATGYAAQLASLNSGVDLMTITPEADLPSGSATYRGVVGFNTTDIGSIDLDRLDIDANPAQIANSLEGYIGAVTVNVDFASDMLDGAVTNLEDYNQRSVSGRLDITNGVLTGTNTAGIGEGFTADAAGAIDGEDYAFDVTGMFVGESGDGMAIYFGSSDDQDAIGTGLAAR